MGLELRCSERVSIAAAEILSKNVINKECISAGGLYASAADLASFGRAILDSKLLTPAQTRWWLKPHTHTSSLTESVGAPWEIYRSTDLTSEAHVTDIYTKDGGIGGYSSLLILLPDYGVAMSVLVAGESTIINTIVETVLNATVPVLDQLSRTQASSRYVGTYASANSSMTISLPRGPGLRVTQWVSYGQDLLQAFAEFFGPAQLRIYPSEMKSSIPGTNGSTVVEESFRGAFGFAASEFDNFVKQCGSWGGFDVLVYGEKALDEFIFRQDSKGSVSESDINEYNTVYAIEWRRQRLRFGKNVDV